MTTPQQTLERAYAALNAAAFAHPSASDSIGTQCSEAAEEIRALLAQQAAAPPAPTPCAHNWRDFGSLDSRNVMWCAKCDSVAPCDMLERCIKHDPTPKTFDNYTRLSKPEGTHTEACPVCYADPEIWQYIATPGDAAQKVVMCSHGDEIGPHDALAGGGCPLYMPPQSFYRPTIREAAKHWNEYAKALNKLRRDNGWKRARILRNEA